MTYATVVYVLSAATSAALVGSAIVAAGYTIRALVADHRHPKGSPR